MYSFLIRSIGDNLGLDGWEWNRHVGLNPSPVGPVLIPGSQRQSRVVGPLVGVRELQNWLMWENPSHISCQVIWKCRKTKRSSSTFAEIRKGYPMLQKDATHYWDAGHGEWTTEWIWSHCPPLQVPLSSKQSATTGHGNPCWEHLPGGVLDKHVPRSVCTHVTDVVWCLLVEQPWLSLPFFSSWKKRCL